MTLAKSGGEFLTVDEWDELNALRIAINDNPASVHPIKQERFTELFVRSLLGKQSNVPDIQLSTPSTKSQKSIV